MQYDKVRIRFRKGGDLRFLSHHDLMRAFERMMRRGRLPFRQTEGFHPQPRLVFAQSLSLGIVGENEVVEIEFTEPLEADTILDRLRSQAPAGLDFLSAVRIPVKTTARPFRFVYSIAIPDAVAADEREAVARRCAELLAETEIWTARLRPHAREVNIRPFVRDLRVVAGTTLEFDLWVTQGGTARADELVRLLGIDSWPDQGAVTTRSVLEILDELPAEVAADASARGPDLPVPQTRPLSRPAQELLPAEEVAGGSASKAAEWGASPNGPVVE